MFTDFYDQQNDEKENQSFPNSSQSILEKSIPKKRQFTESRNSCNVVSNNSSDTSIEEILDSDEDEHIERKKKCYLKNENKMNNEVSIEKKSEHVCCAAKKYFNALFSKDFTAELNTQDELPPIYAQFEHDLGIMLAFRLRNVPADKRLECYEKLINTVRQYEGKK